MSTLQQPWPQQYLRDAIRDEIHLTSVKFGRRVVMPRILSESTPLTPEPPKPGQLISAGAARQSFDGRILPKWRREWSAAGRLHVELGLSISHDKEEDGGTVTVCGSTRRRSVTEAYKDHPSEDAATWAAIVRAAILELEARADQ